jgi:hypothetical protein
MLNLPPSTTSTTSQFCEKKKTTSIKPPIDNSAVAWPPTSPHLYQPTDQISAENKEPASGKDGIIGA